MRVASFIFKRDYAVGFVYEIQKSNTFKYSRKFRARRRNHFYDEHLVQAGRCDLQRFWIGLERSRFKD